MRFSRIPSWHESVEAVLWLRRWKDWPAFTWIDLGAEPEAVLQALTAGTDPGVGEPSPDVWIASDELVDALVSGGPDFRCGGRLGPVEGDRRLRRSYLRLSEAMREVSYDSGYAKLAWNRTEAPENILPPLPDGGEATCHADLYDACIISGGTVFVMMSGPNISAEQRREALESLIWVEMFLAHCGQTADRQGSSLSILFQDDYLFVRDTLDVYGEERERPTWRTVRDRREGRSSLN
jgi:hypothetical protein